MSEPRQPSKDGVTQCPTKTSRILNVVRKGPATTPEVVAITGLPLKFCCSILRQLWQRGMLVRERFDRAGMNHTFVYSLAPRSKQHG